MDISQLDSDGWPEIVTRLGGGAALAASALAHEAFRRQRGVRSAEDLLRLALIYGPGGHSLRVTAAMAAMQGIADISDVALMNRLANAANWLETLCAERLAAIAPPGGPDLKLRIVDGSRLEGPGKSCWRLHACYDTAAGRWCDAEITTMKDGERLDRLAPGPGELRIGDRGYPRAKSLANTLNAGAEVLVRLTWNSLHLIDEAGKSLDWMALFETAGRIGVIDRPVSVTIPRGRFEPLAMRLLILSKPPAATTAARRKVRKDAMKDQRHTIDPRTVAAAGYFILITSLEPQAFPVHRLAAIYRLRWQIELAFKRLKSILDFDRLPAKDPGLARAWLHAHLLFALMIEDVQAELDTLPP